MSLKENHSGGRIVIAIKNLRWTKIFLSSSHTNCAKLWLNDVNSWKVQMQYVLLLCQNKTLLSLWILICLGKFKRPPLAFPRFVKLHNYESVHLCKNLHAHFCTVWLTLAKINLLCMKNAGTQWTMVSYLKKINKN